MLELSRYAAYVVGYFLLAQEVSFRTLARRVAYASRAAASNGYGTVSQLLQPRKTHYGDEIAYMKAVSARVKPDITCYHIVDKVFLELLVVTAPFDKSTFPEYLKRVAMHLPLPPNFLF